MPPPIVMRLQVVVAGVVETCVVSEIKVVVSEEEEEAESDAG